MPRWPNSDSRIDTTHAYFSATLDPGEFSNIVYWSFRDYLKRKNDAQQVGSYLSGSRCQDNPEPGFFTAACINSHAITARGHKGLAGTEAEEPWSAYLDAWKT